MTVWSPQGRLHQVEYAMEAVKLGSATVGLKSKTHAVLIALKRASSELSAHQKKIIPIDKHMGISISGLTADARILRYTFFTIPFSISIKEYHFFFIIDYLYLSIDYFLTLAMAKLATTMLSLYFILP